MTEGQGLRAAAVRLAGFAAVIALLAMPASAAAMAGPPSGLSPRLAELAKPSVRSASHKVQAKKLGLASEGPGSLLRRGNRVLAYVRFDQGAVAGVDALRAAGAEIVSSSRRYQTVTVAAKPGELPAITVIDGVAAVTPALAPIVSSPGPTTSSYTPCFGKETSEGDVQLGAAKARTEFEVDGSGVTVGILSDSYDEDPFAPTGAAEDVASGDLPGTGNPCGHTAPVKVLEDLPGEEGADEGRAMAQIVHDLAPGAALSFATAFNGEPGFAENIKALANAGAKVIADDVSYFEEPFFQEGPVGVAVSEVTASHNVSYFSAAGNDNLISGGHDIASWEAPQYRDAGACPNAVVELSEFFEEKGVVGGLHPTHCMDFNPGGGVDKTFRITVSKGATLIADLQWAEPWEGVETDIDAYLIGPEGAVVAASLEDNLAKPKRPFELVGWENETSSSKEVQFVINRFSGIKNPSLKFALLENGRGVTSTEYETSAGGDTVGPTIFGHGGGEDVMSTGAIPFDENEAPEFYSSRGPVTHYFEPVKGTTPALPLVSPEVLEKPDVVATDGGANTFFGSCVGGTWRFFGTSAAAPHAAAVAALELEAKPLASTAEVKEAQRKSALPVGAFPATAVGSGRVDAVGALEELGLTAKNPGVPIVEAPPPGPCASPREPVSPPTSPPTAPVVPSSTSTPPPKTFIRQKPSKVIRTHWRSAKVVFRFGSDQTGVTFACRIDGGLFRPCPERLVRRFGLGWHTLRVVAHDAAGNGDRTPAHYRFRVKQVG